MIKPDVLIEEEVKSLNYHWGNSNLVFARLREVLEKQCDDTFKKAVRAVYEWQKQECPHYYSGKASQHDWEYRTKGECAKCWFELLKSVEEG